MLIDLLLNNSELDLMQKLIVAALYVIGIVISFSFHEWAHAHAALRNGDDTAKLAGRLTLNPAAHIDPFGFLMILIVGFGWAKPVPYNSRKFKNYRKGEFEVALAGIFTNLVIAFISAFLYEVMYVIVVKTGAEIPVFAFYFVELLGIMNVGLAVFNLIPVFPLDGSHLFDLIFGRKFPKAVMWMHKYGVFILYGIFGLSFLMSRFLGFSPIGIVANFIYGLFRSLFALLGSLIIG